MKIKVVSALSDEHLEKFRITESMLYTMSTIIIGLIHHNLPQSVGNHHL